MQSIFNKRSSLRLQLLCSIILAITIIVTDHSSKSFSTIRAYMDTAVSPLYFLSNSPCKLLDQISIMFSSREKLSLEIKELHDQLLLKHSDLLILDHIKKENSFLRALLSSPIRQYDHKILTQVISAPSDPYSNQVIIDKGSMNNVYEGQPVVSAKGVIGQVIVVGKTTSRVLLLCDLSHALPVQVMRNGIRAIASGNGCSEELQLQYIPDHTDIQDGDILVTSGLDGRFSEGYPVAIVSSIHEDITSSNVVIRAHPIANLQYLRYLILLEKEKHDVRSPEK
ncbi:Cell shape-determining protein MreC [Candidatus Erwinia haradaeae]|uniref:Cell shape-determining protein MreC n=1 Tax=Candidatus Erwinia haradaeae TaxID=1922217 RepID=A0A451DCW0_9GAMM|nr:rod shape-determining protein MreC [Candidatus Erwinia haradaeae]VFP84248.1 Cell shape-determining protein MreC [Candidatus Erwinia haradaeae]